LLWYLEELLDIELSDLAMFVGHPVALDDSDRVTTPKGAFLGIEGRNRKRLLAGITARACMLLDTRIESQALLLARVTYTFTAKLGGTVSGSIEGIWPARPPFSAASQLDEAR